MLAGKNGLTVVPFVRWFFLIKTLHASMRRPCFSSFAFVDHVFVGG
jgi:hypothetical protein